MVQNTRLQDQLDLEQLQVVLPGKKNARTFRDGKTLQLQDLKSLILIKGKPF
jgi:hypothetical protein